MVNIGESHCVFVETNLNTHLVVEFQNDATVSDLRVQVCKEHQERFPEMGEINISAMKINPAENRGKLYNLTEDMNVSQAFDETSGNWNLYADAFKVEKEDQKCPNPESLVPAPTSESCAVLPKENEKSAEDTAETDKLIDVNQPAVAKIAPPRSESFAKLDEVAVGKGEKSLEDVEPCPISTSGNLDNPVISEKKKRKRKRTRGMRIKKRKMRIRSSSAAAGDGTNADRVDSLVDATQNANGMGDKFAHLGSSLHALVQEPLDQTVTEEIRTSQDADEAKDAYNNVEPMEADKIEKKLDKIVESVDIAEALPLNTDSLFTPAKKDDDTVGGESGDKEQDDVINVANSKDEKKAIDLHPLKAKEKVARAQPAINNISSSDESSSSDGSSSESDSSPDYSYRNFLSRNQGINLPGGPKMSMRDVLRSSSSYKETFARLKASEAQAGDKDKHDDDGSALR